MDKRKPGREPGYEIRLTDTGFEYLRNDEVDFEVRWQDVSGIAAYKEDLFSVDQICLAFRSKLTLEYARVTEENAGYDELVGEIERRYPDHDADWWGKVAQPPFQFRWTVIWGDAPQPIACPKCGYDLRGLEKLRCPECGFRMPPGACPDCAGRGSWLTFGFVKAGAGCIVGGGLLIGVGWLVPVPFLASSAIPVLVIGFIWTIVALFNLRAVCDRCAGTGRVPASDDRICDDS